MTPEDRTMLMSIRDTVETLVQSQAVTDVKIAEALRKISNVEDELSSTINLNDKVSQLEIDATHATREFDRRTQILDVWQQGANQEFDRMRQEVGSIFESMRAADALFRTKIQTADDEFKTFHIKVDQTCSALQSAVGQITQYLKMSHELQKEHGEEIHKTCIRLEHLEQEAHRAREEAQQRVSQPRPGPQQQFGEAHGYAHDHGQATGGVGMDSWAGTESFGGNFPRTGHVPTGAPGRGSLGDPAQQFPHGGWDSRFRDPGIGAQPPRMKRMCEEKGLLAAIEACSTPERFREFGEHVRLVAAERHPLLEGWLTWLDRITTEPTEQAVEQWAGSARDAAETMGRDVWEAMAIKLSGCLKKTLMHSMKLGGSNLLRVSRAWWQMLRDTHGRVVDRKLMLSGSVYTPRVAKSWSSFPEAFRSWESAVSEYTMLTGVQVDSSLKAQALLHLAPPDLRETARNQIGIEDRYEVLRDYLLNITGRKTAESSSRPTPMDLSTLRTAPGQHAPADENEDGDDYTEHEWAVYWAGKEARKGKSRNGGKGGGRGYRGETLSEGKSGKCTSCGLVHPVGQCQKASPIQCWTCKGTGHRSPECANNKAGAKAYQVSEEVEPEQAAHNREEASTPAVFSLTMDYTQKARDAWENGDPHEDDGTSSGGGDGSLGLLQTDAQWGKDLAVHSMMAVASAPGTVALKSFMDSGAARSVCPMQHGRGFGIKSSARSRAGGGFRTATNKRIPNLGDRTISGVHENGQRIDMTYAVANVRVALDSISQICDAGAQVIFHREGGYILEANGNKIPFAREDNTYVRTVYVPESSAGPFPRQESATP